MPNWCNNKMTIRHSDPAMIRRAAAAWNQHKFLSEFIPVPYELTLIGGARIDITKITNMDHHRELEAEIRRINLKHFGHEDWYSFCCANWGTKWDIGSDGNDVEKIDGDSFTVNFVSAWAPPTTAYDTLASMGFEISAYYYEPGMAFCGRWEGGIDESFEVPSTIDKVKKAIPADIDAEMFITETMEDWESEYEAR